MKAKKKTKKVVIQLPGIANAASLAKRYELELESLEPIGAELVEATATDEEGFIQEAKDAHGILTSWGFPITRNVIEKLEQCVVIGVGSIGVDMVHVEAATQAGIVVTNVPDVFIEEVADHAMMLLLAMARRTKEMDRMAREGEWYKGRPVLNEIPRLWGQTLGLIGYGNVARCTARRAAPFGFHTIAHDPYVSELKMTGDGVEPVGFGELLARSDYVSIHAPHNTETHHMFSTKQFKAMKPEAVLINTARGPIVDEKALLKALKQGEIAAAALDVLEQEPPDPKNPLLKLPNILITPHLASATTRMRRETRRRAAWEVSLALNGRWPMSCVNPQVLPKLPLNRWQPYPMERGPNR